MRREARGDAASRGTDLVLLACAGTEMPRLFPDDVLTVCACGASIYHRPGALHELGPNARAACLPCAARAAHAQQAWGGRRETMRRCGDEDQAPLNAAAPRRLAPATAGITRGMLVEAAQYLGEFRR